MAIIGEVLRIAPIGIHHVDPLVFIQIAQFKNSDKSEELSINRELIELGTLSNVLSILCGGFGNLPPVVIGST